MSGTNNLGLWFSSFQADVAAQRPTTYPGDGNFALFYATDTGVLSLAARPAVGTTAATWTTIAVGSASLIPLLVEDPSGTYGASWDATKHTLVLKGIPTASTGLTTGMVWSNSGVLTIV